MTSIPETLSEAVRRVLPRAELVFLFGSSGSSGERPESDIDLAVLLGRRLSLRERAELAGELEGLLGRAVDLVDLHQADPIVKMQVLRQGRLVHVGDPRALARFQVYVPGEYFDFKIERREAEKALVARQT